MAPSDQVKLGRLRNFLLSQPPPAAIRPSFRRHG